MCFILLCIVHSVVRALTEGSSSSIYVLKDLSSRCFYTTIFSKWLLEELYKNAASYTFSNILNGCITSKSPLKMQFLKTLSQYVMVLSEGTAPFSTTLILVISRYAGLSTSATVHWSAWKVQISGWISDRWKSWFITLQKIKRLNMSLTFRAKVSWLLAVSSKF